MTTTNNRFKYDTPVISKLTGKSLGKREALRVAVAKDAVRQLQYGKTIAKKGTLFESSEIQKIFDALNNTSIEDFTIEDVPTLNLQKFFLKKSKKPCAVCGLGQCFVSLVRIDNDLDVKSDNFYANTISGNVIFNRLLKVFGKKQLSLIEFAFEGRYAGKAFAKSFYHSVTTLDKVENFYYKNNNVKDRLITIMKNIIKNDGTFKP